MLFVRRISLSKILVITYPLRTKNMRTPIEPSKKIASHEEIPFAGDSAKCDSRTRAAATNLSPSSSFNRDISWYSRREFFNKKSTIKYIKYFLNRDICNNNYISFIINYFYKIALIYFGLY